VIEVRAEEVVLQRWPSPSFSSSSSSSLQDTKVIATPHQSGIIYSTIPPLDSLPIPTVTSPSNIASIPANSLVKSNILVPVTTYDGVIGFYGESSWSS